MENKQTQMIGIVLMGIPIVVFLVTWKPELIINWAIFGAGTLCFLIGGYVYMTSMDKAE